MDIEPGEQNLNHLNSSLKNNKNIFILKLKRVGGEKQNVTGGVPFWIKKHQTFFFHETQTSCFSSTR